MYETKHKQITRYTTQGSTLLQQYQKSSIYAVFRTSLYYSSLFFFLVVFWFCVVVALAMMEFTPAEYLICNIISSTLGILILLPHPFPLGRSTDFVLLVSFPSNPPSKVHQVPPSITLASSVMAPHAFAQAFSQRMDASAAMDEICRRFPTSVLVGWVIINPGTGVVEDVSPSW